MSEPEAPGRPRRVLIAAGGTGGHVHPALATAQALLRLDPTVQIKFMTSGQRSGERALEASSFPCEPLFPGRSHAPGRWNVPAYAGAAWRARRVVTDFRPDVIAGFGGYLTLCAGIAALGPLPVALLRLAFGGRADPPLVLFEQNVRVGKAVSWLKDAASHIALAFPILDPECLPSGRASVEGNPLRESFDADTAVDAPAFGLEPGRPTVVAVGGSQGARGVNRMVLGMRAELARRCPGVQILMLTGDVDHAAVVDELARSPEPHTVAVPFESRMNDVYRLADVVVARAGATTLSEVARIGKPLALVPYPYGDGHQFDNARLFERVGGAVIVEEGEGAAVRLLHAVARWLADPAARAAAAEKARSLHRADAATRCAQLVSRLAAGSPRP